MAKVVSVEYVGEEDVYNMEVKDHHNYSVAGGLIFHNCRYGLMSRPSPVDGSSFMPGAREYFGANEEDDDDFDGVSEIANWYGL